MIKFSIITPTYNRSERYLGECILSVQEQKKGDFDWEHIIVDDGSTDGTKEFVASLMSKDSHIKYIYQKNSGPAKALKNGIENSKGDYICYVDDDDLLPKESLFERYKFIKTNPKVDWFYGNASWIDEKGTVVETGFQSRPCAKNFYDTLLMANFIHGGTPVIKAEAIKKINWPSWLERGQDYFLWLELARPEKKLTVSYLNKLVYIYRKHELSFTNDYLKEKKSLDKKIALNDKIRDLHPKELTFLAKKAANLIEEEKRYKGEAINLKNELKDLKIDLENCKKELAQKDSELAKIINSRGWKYLEKIRRSIGK